MDKIVVLDFGSQYSHLICRRIREFSVYAELVPFDISYEELQKHNPKGIIFSGGPSSVYNLDAPVPVNEIFNMNLPLLGICYGAEILALTLGGTIRKITSLQKGIESIQIIKENHICKNPIDVFESHGYEISKLPSVLISIGKSNNCKNEIIQYGERLIFGTQFHPEMSPDGNDLIEKFCSL